MKTLAVARQRATADHRRIRRADENGNLSIGRERLAEGQSVKDERAVGRRPERRKRRRNSSEAAPQTDEAC
jgi:hypothetical protein